MLGAVDKESEFSPKTSTLSQDVSCVLNGNDSTGLLDTKSHHDTDSPSKRNLVKSGTIECHKSGKTVTATCLLATLDVGGGHPTTDSATEECVSGCETSQSGTEKPSVVKSECSSGDKIKTSSVGMKSLSKSFSWSCNKLGFQKSKSITSLDRSAAVIKDFKNPFKKTDLSPRVGVTLQVTDRTTVMETSASSSLPLTVEEEKAVVDDPSPADSGLELGPLSSPNQDVTCYAASDVSVRALLYNLFFRDTPF
jgi:hypothetical protein